MNERETEKEEEEKKIKRETMKSRKCSGSTELDMKKIDEDLVPIKIVTISQ